MGGFRLKIKCLLEDPLDARPLFRYHDAPESVRDADSDETLKAEVLEEPAGNVG